MRKCRRLPPDSVVKMLRVTKRAKSVQTRLAHRFETRPVPLEMEEPLPLSATYGLTAETLGECHIWPEAVAKDQSVGDRAMRS